jgi:hypothetical protein
MHRFPNPTALYIFNGTGSLGVSTIFVSTDIKNRLAKVDAMCSRIFLYPGCNATTFLKIIYK